MIAYLNPLSPDPQPEDTMETIEIQFNPEIWELPASLRYDPVAIFEYVQANIKNELYYGSMKGAAETLRQRSGNDLDQASLLITLYRSENEMANLLKVSLVRPILSEAMVGNVYNSTLLFGQPQTIDWKGVFIDSDLRISEPVPQSQGDDARLEFMKLSGLEGSILENRIFEDNFKVESVSAAKVIQLAHFAGVPVHRIDSVNLQTILPTLTVSEQIRSEIENAVNHGHTVIIPEYNLPYEAWTGTGGKGLARSIAVFVQDKEGNRVEGSVP